MPHIHLETTSNVQENADLPDILEALVQELSSYETISSPSIKAYHTLRINWAMGEGAATGFVHCTVGLIKGRPTELRKEIAEGMVRILREKFSAATSNGDAAITLEVREMDDETYQKGP